MSLFIYPPTPVSVTVPPTGILVNGAPTEINQNTSDPSLSQTMPSLSHFMKNGTQVVVNYDGVTKANINAVPVMLVGADGTEATINVTTGDLNIQTTHTGVNPDSMQIGDGTTILAMTLTGEAKVHDAEVLAELKKLILQLPATLGSKIDDESLSVTQSTEDKAVQAAILAKIIAAPSTEAKQDDTITAIGNLAKLTDTQPVSAATLPLPTGAATQTTLAAVDAKLANIRESLPVARGEYPSTASTSVTLSTEDKATQEAIKTAVEDIGGNLDTTEDYYRRDFGSSPLTVASSWVTLRTLTSKVTKISVTNNSGNELVIRNQTTAKEIIIGAGAGVNTSLAGEIAEVIEIKAVTADAVEGIVYLNFEGV